MQIPGLRGLSPFKLAKESVKKFIGDDMVTHACAIAYETLLSLFPFLIFLIALLGFLELSNFFEWLLERAQILLPQEAMQPVNEAINKLQQRNGGLLSFGMIMALWAASAAMRATMHALNFVYGVTEGRPLWKRVSLSIFYTIDVAAMLIAAGILLAVGPQAMHWVTHQAELEKLFVILWSWLRWPAALLLLTLAVGVIYHVAPDVEQKFRFITPGAMLAVISWIALSLGFKYYVSNFGGYDVYGSIGAIIVLLLHFFISASILLFGAEINVVIEHHSAKGKNSDHTPLVQ